MQRREFIAAAAGAVAVAAGVVGRATAREGAGITGAGSGPIDVATFHASRRFARTAFGRIAYVERGAGPAALFLHGLPLNGFQWRGAVERLAPYRRCIAPDSMGLGYGEIPEGQALAPEAQVEMLAALLDALSVPAVDLVGSDSGGAVAQLFVARLPDRVRSLLLTNCDAHEDSPPPALLPVIAASRAGTFADEVLAPQLRDKASSRLSTGLAGCCYTDPARLTPEAIDCYLAPLLSSPLRKAQLHAYCVALERNPLLAIEPALKRCQAPLRVVWGTGDTIFAASSPDWLDRTFPRSRGIRRVDGANLFFPEEFPDVIAEEARRLWLGA
ncbi:MAG: alpha/beta fold hydrolase [Vicinamibacteria bacterium]